jgi:hypothetical protein
MRRKLIALALALTLLVLIVPSMAGAQDRYGRFIRRDRNGLRVGEGRLTLFDGPGIVNYEHRHRWMEGPGGAAIVIGTGAGAGAATGALAGGKKGAAIGALIGGGAATALWLYKNRRHKHKIF